MAVKLTLPPTALLSQVAKLGSLLVLLLLALLLPAFLRVAYGYLLFNGIVFALGIQAFVGSTASIADESSSTGQDVGVAASPFQRAGSVRPNNRTAVADGDRVVVPAFVASNIIELKIKTKEVVLKVLKKCPSTASIFFLSALNGSKAGGEEKVRQEEQDDFEFEVDLDGDMRMSRQELFANAERFIGNFRKQLRIKVAGNGERWAVPRSGFIDPESDSGTRVDSVRFDVDSAFPQPDRRFRFGDSTVLVLESIE